MYKVFGFEENFIYGRVVRVEFFFLDVGRWDYVYFLGNFNVFNEGFFRMKYEDKRWIIEIKFLEGFWRYVFFVGGEFFFDFENLEKEFYWRFLYKFEREVSLVKIVGNDMVFYRFVFFYFYFFGDRIYVFLRSKKGKVDVVYLVIDDMYVKMWKKVDGEVFEYYEVVL